MTKDNAAGRAIVIGDALFGKTGLCANGKDLPLGLFGKVSPKDVSLGRNGSFTDANNFGFSRMRPIKTVAPTTLRRSSPVGL